MTITKNLNEEDSSGHVEKTEMRELLEKNVQLTEEMHVMMKKMEKFIFWSRVSSYLKFVFIVLPLILSYFILSPILKSAFSQYQSLLGGDAGMNLFNIIPKK